MFDQNVKRLDVWDIGLTKLSVACFVLAAVAGSPILRHKVQAANPGLLLLAALALAVRPTYRFFK
jgi:hypothetical protein